MPLLESFVVAVGLGADAFSVALGVGFGGVTARQSFRLSWHFGLFQFFMPLVGWTLGHGLAAAVHGYGRWAGGGILLTIGTKMLVESLKHGDRETTNDQTRGWPLVGLSLATSIDALGVGVSLGVAGAPCVHSAVIIGIVAALMTLGGLWLARTLSALWGKRLETAGAVLLLLVGAKMLLP